MGGSGDIVFSMNDRGLTRSFLPLVLAAFLATVGQSVRASDEASSSASATANKQWPKERFWKEARNGNFDAAERLLADGEANGIPMAFCLKARFGLYGLMGNPDTAKIANISDFTTVVRIYDSVSHDDCLEKTLFLAALYEHGLGVTRDPRMADHLYRKAFMSYGLVDAAENDRWSLIEWYIQRYNEVIYKDLGLDIAPGMKRAAQWWSMVGTIWTPEDQYELAVAYMAGDGVPMDNDMGHGLLRHAASRGSEAAQGHLQRLIDQGKVLGYSPGPFEYLARSAAYGGIGRDRQAMARQALEDLRKPNLAYIWFYAAQEAGDPNVGPTLRELEKELPPEVIEWAKHWVDRGWWP